MFSCLFFLTGVNFVVFPQSNQVSNTKHCIAGKSDKDPSAPVEEKAGSNSAPAVQEEYLHEKHHPDENSHVTYLSRHPVLGSEKLEIVHFELVSPPPKS